MKKKICLLGTLLVFLLWAAACGAAGPQGGPAPDAAEEAPIHTGGMERGPAGDIDGDGIQETLSLKLTANHTGAVLCVNGEEALALTVKGEFDFSCAQIVAADMDSDGRDEVLIVSSIPARYSGFTFQYAEFEDDMWRELAARWPETELTFSAGWTCTLTVNGIQQTERIENSWIRDAYFDENGIPYAEKASFGCYTDAAEHIIDGSGIHFTAHGQIRGAGAAHGESGFEFAFPCTVTVGEGELAVDSEQLCQAILSAFVQGSTET